MKFIKINKSWVLLFVFFAVQPKCDMPSKKLLLINNTNESYYYRLLTDTSDLKKGLYVYSFAARDSTRPLFVRAGKGGWEYVINNYSPDSTLKIYLFDHKESREGIVNNELTEKIIKQRKFKKLTYKVKDLEKLKWTIVIR